MQPPLVIIDFNRTIYDPDTDAATPGSAAALREFKERGFRMFLVSRNEPGRTDRLEALGFGGFFEETAFVDDKEDAIRRLVAKAPERAYVIGDHLHTEIRVGNRYGARTIWVRRGKFANLVPETSEDHPWKTVKSMEEAVPLVS